MGTAQQSWLSYAVYSDKFSSFLEGFHLHATKQSQSRDLDIFQHVDICVHACVCSVCLCVHVRACTHTHIVYCYVYPHGVWILDSGHSGVRFYFNINSFVTLD